MTSYTSDVKTAVSVPDDVFAQADRLASVQGVSRSELYTRALRSYIASQVPDDVTQRINDVVKDAPSQDLGALAADDLVNAGRWEW
jgi:hypothetical protein